MLWVYSIEVQRPNYHFQMKTRLMWDKLAQQKHHVYKRGCEGNMLRCCKSRLYEPSLTKSGTTQGNHQDISSKKPKGQMYFLYLLSAGLTECNYKMWEI